MQRNRLLVPVALVSLVLAACGGTAATQGPDGGGSGTDAPAVTDPPAATQAGGNGGEGNGNGNGGGDKPAGWDRYGKLHFELTGPVEKSGDYGFIPAASIFGGSQGTSLSFAIEGTDEIASILIGADGTVLFSYGGPELSAPAAPCETSNWNVGATSASGSFVCDAALVLMASGATVSNGHITGSFEARAN